MTFPAKFKDVLLCPGAFLYDLLPAKVLVKAETRIIADIAKNISAASILDIGSGTGYLAIEIAKTFPNTHILGVDISRQMMQYAKNKAAGIQNLSFEIADAADLPFQNNSFDFIISTASLHHWKNPAAVFKECYRVLKAGKQAWIYDLCYDALVTSENAKKDLGPLLYRISAVVTLLHCYSHHHFQTAIKELLAQTGFNNNFQMELTDIWLKTTLQKT